ncbi:MAG: heat-inducible transcription repressor HrcA [Actinobacteria bacterium]|nr:heat-inducible transcription repressor HrcA [Actinomycetota bacterium]
MRLTDRKKEILKEVIVRFIDTAEPVSSQNIVEGTSLGLSSATIRKEMAELEKLGYLTHPHTSAGRMPSDKGYRFFVDSFLKDEAIMLPEKRNNLPGILLDVDRKMEIDTILKKSSEQLAKITSYLSMIVAPAVYQSKFRHIELLELSMGNMLLVLITDTGRVYKKSFVIEGPYNSLDFQSVSNILNSNFRGKNIADIDFLNIRISESYSYLIPLLKKIIESVRNCAQEAFLYNRVFMHGASSILNQPDFIDVRKIQKILNIIENEYLLAEMFMNFSEKEEFVIKIGSEISEEGTDDLSLVASKYRLCGHSTGMVGVLGPKRMDYFKIVNIINAFAENLKDLFS